MKPKEEKSDVGVIVARFQVPDLHEAHLDLIQSVIDRHSKIIIFLGLSPCKTTINNPLDFESRKQMILQSFPDVNVLYIKDEREDSVWCKKLDNQIEDIIGPNQTVILYGSRKSFIDKYKGKFKTIELESTRIVSGTEIRKIISNKVKSSKDFRHGVIWAVYNTYPYSLATVDIAIVDPNNHSVLLAKKPGENKYRFVGGFSTPQSNSYEDDAKREVLEETGLTVEDLQYIKSFKIKDWRYEDEQTKIKTLFFMGIYTFGCPCASDDISEVKWFKISNLDVERDIMEEHQEMMTFFKNMYLKKM